MIRVHARFQPAFQRLGIDSCAAVSRFFLGNRPIVEDEEVIVQPAQFPIGPGRSEAVYFKQYGYRPPIWKFIGRPSKARCEFHNYARFAALGIPSTTAYAWGEQRDLLGRLIRAFILTQAIPGAMPLPSFVQQFCPNRTTFEFRQLRDQIGAQIAQVTRRFHSAGFYHYDLVWRNILVTRQDTEPSLWWIDCPRGRFDRWSPWREKRRLKDLASLDKTAMLRCSTGERLRFLRRYLEKKHLDQEVSALAQAVVAYRQRRWPDHGEMK